MHGGIIYNNLLINLPEDKGCGEGGGYIDAM